jgi:hypothetical protein
MAVLETKHGEGRFARDTIFKSIFGKFHWLFLGGYYKLGRIVYFLDGKVGMYICCMQILGQWCFYMVL